MFFKTSEKKDNFIQKTVFKTSMTRARKPCILNELYHGCTRLYLTNIRLFLSYWHQLYDDFSNNPDNVWSKTSQSVFKSQIRYYTNSRKFEFEFAWCDTQNTITSSWICMNTKANGIRNRVSRFRLMSVICSIYLKFLDRHTATWIM